MMHEYHLLDENKINKIESMPKKDRVIAVGMEMKNDKEFSKALEASFNKTMKNFIDDNKLDKDYDILSIKRDAAFVVNKEILIHKYGNYIDFKNKNQYHAYIYLKPFEFYFGNDELEIKGLNKELVSKHKNGMIGFISDVIELCETSQMNRKKINRYLHEFILAYKQRELDFDMYREFNTESKFRYTVGDNSMLMDDIDEIMLSNIDISYNYINFILPIVQTIC